MSHDLTQPASAMPAVPCGLRIAAFVVGLAGLVAVAVGFAVLALARETSWLLVGGGVAFAGLLVVVASTRIARLPARRALIAVLGALLVGPPVGHAVRSHVDFAKRYSPPRDTATDLRNLGVALEARAIDEGGYPPTTAVGALA